MKKETSKLIIKGPVITGKGDKPSQDKGYYFTYRAPCPVGKPNLWPNPNTWSMPGADVKNPDEALKDLIEEVKFKYGLETKESDWEKICELENSAATETNGEAKKINIWLHEAEVNKLDIVPRYSAGIICIPCAEFWQNFKHQISLGIKPIFDAVEAVSQDTYENAGVARLSKVIQL